MTLISGPFVFISFRVLQEWVPSVILKLLACPADTGERNILQTMIKLDFQVDFV